MTKVPADLRARSSSRGRSGALQVGPATRIEIQRVDLDTLSSSETYVFHHRKEGGKENLLPAEKLLAITYNYTYIL